MEQQTNTDEFHDSESEDIYDLYNACNGVLHNGLLDIRKLEEYTPKESQALNFSRLREIWAHTASGCSKCDDIVRALNRIRGVLKESAEGSRGEPDYADPTFAESS